MKKIYRPVRSAALQYKPVKGAPDLNVNRMIRLLEEGIISKTDIITLPEMCTTGYIWENPESILPYAEPALGKTFLQFSSFCSKHQCYLAYGYPEIDNGTLYNSQNIIGSDGSLVARYRKTHLFTMDTFWAQPGNTGFFTVDTPIGRLGPGICMDLNYDDFVDFHRISGTDIMVFSTNWLDENIDVHSYWDMRLEGFMGTVIMANTWGYEDGTLFSGGSAVYSRGRYVLIGPYQSDKLITADI